MEQNSTANKHIANIEDYDKYLLHGRGEIIQKLRQLGKDKNLITAHIGSETILTAVIDVLADNDLLVLDYASDAELNQKLIKAKRVILHAKYKGITAQFTVSNIKKARLKGRTVLACSLPTDLLWVQRRETYRVRIPLSSNSICHFFTTDKTSIECELLDISATGFAINNENNKLEFEIGDIFYACQLQLAEFGSISVDIEIRNEVQIKETLRIGCTFLNSNADLNSMIQRYIHTIDSLQRKTTD